MEQCNLRKRHSIIRLTYAYCFYSFKLTTFTRIQFSLHLLHYSLEHCNEPRKLIPPKLLYYTDDVELLLRPALLGLTGFSVFSRLDAV